MLEDLGKHKQPVKSCSTNREGANILLGDVSGPSFSRSFARSSRTPWADSSPKLNDVTDILGGGRGWVSSWKISLLFLLSFLFVCAQPTNLFAR